MCTQFSFNIWASLNQWETWTFLHITDRCFLFQTVLFFHCVVSSKSVMASLDYTDNAVTVNNSQRSHMPFSFIVKFNFKSSNSKGVWSEEPRIWHPPRLKLAYSPYILFCTVYNNELCWVITVFSSEDWALEDCWLTNTIIKESHFWIVQGTVTP